MTVLKRFAIVSIIVITIALLYGSVHAESEAVKKFRKTWAEAGKFTANQVGAVRELCRYPTPETAQVLLDVIFQEKVCPEAKDAAFKGLKGMQGYPKVVKVIRENSTEHRSWQARAACCRLLGKMDDEESVTRLNKCLSDKHWQVQTAAAEAVRAYRKKSSVEALVNALQKATGRAAADMMRALNEITEEKDLTSAEDWKNWWDSHKDKWSVPPELEEGSYAEAEKRDPNFGKDGKYRTSSGFPIYGTEVGKAKAVIFIIDTSGSMRVEGKWGKSGKKTSRLNAVKEELKKVIDEQLSNNAKFNIVTFANEVKPWKSKLVKASRGNRKSAKKFVQGLKPDGMTNTYAVLKHCYDDKNVDTVYFLSDGCPTINPMAPEQIMAMVRGEATNRGIVIHTIAFLVGRGEDFGVIENKSKMKKLMRDIAEATKGKYKELEQ
ncbi:MAG: VWA domain-containing protein [Planctomycetota bacterium]|nr:MAG: VWA domain-containing protein [Planctomycetota bacterium]